MPIIDVQEQYSDSPPSPGKGPLWEAFVFNNLRSRGPQQDPPPTAGAGIGQQYESGVCAIGHMRSSLCLEASICQLLSLFLATPPKPLVCMLLIFPQACIFCDSDGTFYDGRFFECHETTDTEQQREHNKFCKNCAYGFTKIRGRKLRCPRHGGALHSKRHREDPGTPKPKPVPHGG